MLFFFYSSVSMRLKRSFSHIVNIFYYEVSSVSLIFVPFIIYIDI